MPQLQQSNFIPDAPLSSKGGGGKRKKAIGLIPLIATVIFVVSIVLAGGVFFMERLQASSLESKKQALDESQAAFDPLLIRELTQADRRFKLSEALARQHIAVTPFFRFLEENTLRGVSFTEFDFTRRDSSGITIDMEGKARDYPTVALQSDKFGRNPFIQNPIFSDFDLDLEGNIIFNLRMQIDTAFLQYANNI